MTTRTGAIGGGTDLGTAVGRVVIDYSGVTGAITGMQNAFQSAISNIGQSISRLGDEMSSLGGNLTMLTAPFAAVGVAGVRAASDFESLINQIRIFGNVAPEQMDTVRQFALQMGADTMFSASDAAAALLNLLKAGQDLESAMTSLTDVMNLAAAGNISLEQASMIVTSSLAIFGLQASEATRVTDALARAANASNADISDLGQALTNVGPVAAMFGLSVEETAAILAVFANNGIIGAEAGTQLKSMLLNLTRPTDSVKGALDRLGVSLYDSNGNIKDFNTFILELDAALDQLPVEEQNELMQILGGSYGIVGLSALRASNGIGDMNAAMAAAPDAATVATEQMDTFAGTVESLKGSVETLMINAFTPFMENVLKPLGQQLIEIVNRVNDWVVANPELVQQIATIGAGIAAIGPTLFIVGRGISAFGGIISTLGTVMGLLLSPIGLVAAGVGALGVAFATNFMGIRDTIMPIIEEIVSFVQDTFSYLITGDFTGQFDSQSGDHPMLILLRTIRDAAESLVNWLRDDLFPALDTLISENILPAVQSFIGFIGNAWSIVETPLANLFDWFTQTALPAILEFISGTVIPGVGAFIDLLRGIWDAVAPGLLSVLDWFVTTGLPAIGSAVDWVWNSVLQPLIAGLQTMWETVSPALASIFDWFVTTGLPTVYGALESFYNNILVPVVDLFVALWETISPALESLWNWFVNEGFPAIVQALDWFWHNVLDPVVGVLAGIWDVVSASLGELLRWFTEYGLPAIRDAVTWLHTVVLQPMINALTWIWDTVKPGVEALANGIIGAVRDIIKWLEDLVDKINNIIETWRGVQDVARDTGVVLAQGLATGQITTGQAGQAVAGAIQAETGSQGWLADFFFGAVGQQVGALAGIGMGGSRDVGGMGVADTAYAIGVGAQPELFVPQTGGQFIPNIDQVIERGLSGGGGGFNFQAGSIVIHANSAAEGEAAADGFMRRMQEEQDFNG